MFYIFQAGVIRSDEIMNDSVAAPLLSKKALVSEELASKFASEKETPYTRWVKSQGLDIISGFYVPNLHTTELKPWPRRGGRGRQKNSARALRFYLAADFAVGNLQRLRISHGRYA